MFQPQWKQCGDCPLSRAALEHEKLIVYRKALVALGEIESLYPVIRDYDLKDQLRRASTSVVLNIAEGANRQSPLEKRRHYIIARGSLGEAAAALDILQMRSRISSARHTSIHSALVEIARMLGVMCRPRSS